MSERSENGSVHAPCLVALLAGSWSNRTPGSSTTRHAFLVTLFVMAAPLLASCKKCASERRHPPPAPVSSPWDKRLGVIPSGAQMCGVDVEEPETLRLSFAKDPNPFVTLVQQLEAKGWSRATQGTKDLDCSAPS